MKRFLLILGCVGLLWAVKLERSVCAQFVVVEDIQSAPLETEYPYTSLETAWPAKVRLQVNEPASVSASSPFPEGFADPRGTYYSSLLRYSDREVSQGESLNINRIGEAEVELEMQVVRPTPYPANSYNYRVVLTITVQ